MNLRTDDRGAITVVALFLAVFAIAILYTVVGTAEVILARERLQDAADVAALSSAVMHARSMNLLVLINLIMAALLAVLVTIKLVESLAIIGIVVAGALAWVTAGATLAAIPPLQSVQQTMHSTYEDVKDPIYQALEALNEVSDKVAEVTPRSAASMGNAEVARFGAPVQKGVVEGTRDTLPVANGSFDELCGKAGGLPAMLARTGLESAGIPALPELMGALESPMESLTGQFSDWFCGDSDGGGGDGGSSKPTHRQKVERSYPQIESMWEDAEASPAQRRAAEAARACAAGEGLRGTGGPPSQATNPACEESLEHEEAAEADPATGGCAPGRDCSLEGPYETRVQLAREQCDPRIAPRPFAYWYQTRAGTVAYEWTGAFWKRGEPHYDRPVRHGGDPNHDPGEFAPPCGPEEVHPSVAVGYRHRAHLSGDVSEINPVCSSEEAPEVPTLLPARGTKVSVKFTEVTHLLGCRRKVEEEIQIEAGESAQSEGGSKSPKILESTADLGDENFQIRALVQGDSGGHMAASIVRLALWGKEEPTNSVGQFARFGGFSVAGAEYFYDGADGDEHDRAAWMWNMKWRARLRRFRVSEDAAGGTLRQACKGSLDASVCSAIFQLGEASHSLFLH